VWIKAGERWVGGGKILVKVQPRCLSLEGATWAEGVGRDNQGGAHSRRKWEGACELIKQVSSLRGPRQREGGERGAKTVKQEDGGGSHGGG